MFDTIAFDATVHKMKTYMAKAMWQLLVQRCRLANELQVFFALCLCQRDDVHRR